jgi:hypothetical protein
MAYRWLNPWHRTTYARSLRTEDLLQALLDLGVQRGLEMADRRRRGLTGTPRWWRRYERAVGVVEAELTRRGLTRKQMYPLPKT